MQNALSPDLMPPAERLNEVASILAAGLLRLRVRETTANPSEQRQVLLDFPAGRSSHGGNKVQQRQVA